MRINEISRLDQLTDAGKWKFTQLMSEHKVFFKSLISEIYTTVKNMPERDFIDSLNWYRDANSFAFELANEFNTTTGIASGVISAVSPRMPWLRNKESARKVFLNLDSVSDLSPHDAAKAFEMGLYSNFAMAIKIARGEDISDTLSGTKRRSFYNNIVDPVNGDSVTIDTWMIRSVMNTTGMNLASAGKFLVKSRVALGGTGVGYFAVAESVRTVAKDMNLIPQQVQAAYWTAVSGSTNGGRTDIG